MSQSIVGHPPATWPRGSHASGRRQRPNNGQISRVGGHHPPSHRRRPSDLVQHGGAAIQRRSSGGSVPVHRRRRVEEWGLGRSGSPVAVTLPWRGGGEIQLPRPPRLAGRRSTSKGGAALEEKVHCREGRQREGPRRMGEAAPLGGLPEGEATPLGGPSKGGGCAAGRVAKGRGSRRWEGRQREYTRV